MNVYKHLLERRERSLTLRDTNRRIFPFSWGLRWISSNGEGPPQPGDPLGCIKECARKALSDSDSFFEAPPIRQWSLEGDLLTFATPTPSYYPENNKVYGRLFEARGSKKAVIVVPQWNADRNSHVRLCQFLSWAGITAVRLSLPYHEQRRPAEMIRADHMVGPNIGRTLHATRQAVLEVRQLAAWLRQQGYERVAVMGTSIGSCVAYLAFVHDSSLCVGVFNHVSSFFADVVWTGLSTRYVRWGLEGYIGLEDLRECWAPISPWFFIQRLKDRSRPHLLITARYDLTFRPELSEKVFRQYDACRIPYQAAVLPCGHYTTATFPFQYLDGWHICRFLMRQLSA